jgi:NAD(P)H-flavin reductase
MALGDIIKVRGPFGRPMELRGASGKKGLSLVILVAAGSGITPMLQWLHYMFAAGEIDSLPEHTPRVALLYINESRASIMASERLTHVAHRLQGRFIVHHLLSVDEGVTEGASETIKVATAEPRSIDPQAVGKETSIAYSEGRLDQTQMNSFVSSVLSTFGPALVNHAWVSSSSGGVGGGECMARGGGGMARELLHKDVCRASVCGPPGLVQAAKKMLAAVPGWQSDIHEC